MIDSFMCFRQSDISYPEPNDAKVGLIQIGELVYVKNVDE